MHLRPALAAFVVAALVPLAGCEDEPPSPAAAQPSATPSTPSTPSAPATPSPGSPYPSYVALGDSYTAAPGVPETEQQSGCLRSSGNYPHLVAAALGSQLVDVSCSGASTLSLVGVQRAGGHESAPQFDALTPDTSLVTIGIGGNDLDLFRTLIGVCTRFGTQAPTGSPCKDYTTANGTHQDILLEKVVKIGDRVKASAQGIHDRSPHAKVVVVGYPQPVPAEGTCEILPLAEGDYPYVRSIVVALDDALRAAARQAHATYVDLLGPSEGHDICAGDDAWINGFATDVERALAFHPFANEQQAVADLVVGALG